MRDKAIIQKIVIDGVLYTQGQEEKAESKNYRPISEMAFNMHET